MRRFVTDQRGVFIDLAIDYLDHAEIDADHSLSVHERRKRIRFIALDNIEIALYLRGAIDTKVRQRHFLHRPGRNRPNDLLVAPAQADGGVAVENKIFGASIKLALRRAAPYEEQQNE
jgi:hypothetical protein